MLEAYHINLVRAWMHSLDSKMPKKSLQFKSVLSYQGSAFVHCEEGECEKVLSVAVYTST